MVIKELEISGFKSFANKTRVHFDQSLTAVVGPNGCGKSNILDSVKWVLGEKSVKSIRGEKMEDVIFSGTESRKPANFAEVMITFDNSQRIFDVELDTVRIGRRLYRDGQSQYFLSDRRVSRKEIEMLLMDTGIGKSSYTFMEQGQMDMILSSKPEERRYIFEEAAGVSRFKAQKTEAVKNLENAQVNITRLEDILRELEREFRLKSSQAEKTKKYNELIEHSRRHDLKIRYVNLIEIEKRLNEFNEKISRKKADREKVHQKILQFQESLETLEKERLQKLEELQRKDITNQISREKIEEWKNGIKTLEERKEGILAQKSGIKLQLQKVEKRAKALEDEIHQQNQMTLELNVHIEDAHNALEDLKKRITALTAERDSISKQLENRRTNQKDNQENIRELRNQLEIVIQDLLASLKEETQNYQKFESEQNALRSDLIKKLENLLTAGKNLVENSSDANTKSLEQTLNSLNPGELTNSIQNLSSLSPGLHHLLFEKGGIHSRKEDLDEQIADGEKQSALYEHEIQTLMTDLETMREEESSLIKQQETLLGDIKSFNVQKDSLQEKEKALNEQLAHEQSSLSFIQSQYQKIDRDALLINQEMQTMEKNIAQLEQGIRNEISQIEKLEQAIEKINERKEKVNIQLRQETEKAEEIIEAMNDLEIKMGTLIGSREAQLQEIYNDYNLTLDEVSEQMGTTKIQLANEKGELQKIQKEIEELGPINPLAIEELTAVKQMVDHNQQQLDDILKAKGDILSIINDIQKKSEQLFSETFSKVQENFAVIFQRLFNGGIVDLRLTEPDKPLESGIEIQVAPPGKRPRSLRLLSGGEKALTATSLLFALYMVKSSPFCVLDEIDAPLDDQNVGRFLTMLDDFRDQTQFIIITHNKKTMHKAEAIFGVTMEEPGISKLMSVEVKKAAPRSV